MAEDSQTFSESWYRIADLKICLHPGVRVRRQRYRGERWYVLENPFSNQYFRLRPAAYEFVARLRPDRTVESVWRECLDRFPDEAPGQEAVIQLLSQVYLSNLLQYNFGEDTSALFKRFEQRRQRELRAQFFNLMFMRFPLLDPDSFLVRAMPVVGKLISPVGALLWLVTIGWALKIVADNFGALSDQSQSVLAPDNLPLLYVGMVIVKTLHEFGHAFFCRRFGGEVHVMGIMLMIFTPVPYVDATSSWGFRSRWKRALVGGAGMIVELFVAAIATFIWAKTSGGTLHNLAYNIMFVASVSTLVFNLNPLMRFDGYYILSDLVEIPNLNQRSTWQLKFLVERYLFGLKKAESPAQTPREGVWLVAFGLASSIYRVFVFGGILLVVADRFLLLGIIMAAICLIGWILRPLVLLVSYLGSSPVLDRHRPRAVAVTLVFVAVVFLLLEVIPFPSHFRAPGLLQARQRSEVINEATGGLEAVLTPPGMQVRSGQPLLQLRNPELKLELEAARARYGETQARLRQAMRTETPDLKPLNSRLESVTNQVRRLEVEVEALVVRARHDGIWVSPELKDYVGRWLPRGTQLGLVLDPKAFEFIATVKQEDVDRLFARSLSHAEIRLFGQAGKTVEAGALSVIPAEKRSLPSPALGWAGGGEMAVSSEDNQGRRTVEPFFEVRAEVIERADVTIVHGRSGKIRFDLSPEPLLPRWIRSLRQLMQKRYQI